MLQAGPIRLAAPPPHPPLLGGYHFQRQLSACNAKVATGFMSGGLPGRRMNCCRAHRACGHVRSPAGNLPRFIVASHI